MRIRQGLKKRFIVHGFFFFGCCFSFISFLSFFFVQLIWLFYPRLILFSCFSQEELKLNFHMGCNIGKIGNDEESDLKNSLHEDLKDTLAPLGCKLL